MKTKLRKAASVFGVIMLLGPVILLGGGIWLGWSYYVVDQRFSNGPGGYFDLSDQSSNATVKLHYWNEFGSSLQQFGLTSGWAVHGTIFCQGCDTNPKYNLTNSYQANFLTIQERLQSLVDSCPNQNISCQSTFNYAYALNQIELTEVCWFPINYFKQGYEIQQGLPLSGLTAPSNDYLCSTATTTN